ncbi:MAG: hypothetical protein QM536_04415 [Chitinophagaceae bacterium]|nr:hypothetical protein [Chitinophagaceae bacterium]
MNRIKRYGGIIWIILSPCFIYFMCSNAFLKIKEAPEGFLKINTILQWSIILIVFIPICIGMIIFGYYAMKGEYDSET